MAKVKSITEEAEQPRRKSRAKRGDDSQPWNVVTNTGSVIYKGSGYEDAKKELKKALTDPHTRVTVNRQRERGLISLVRA